MSEITIRLAEPRDADAFHGIYNQRPVAAGTAQVLHTSNAERRSWPPSSSHFRLLVAELDGQVVGSAGLEIFQGRRSHVGTIGMGVDERYHGQGIGKALMAALVDLADNWYGLYRIELEVFTDNAVAVHLYQRFGFEIEGTLRALMYREGAYADAYAMARVRRDSV